jgi:transposase
MKALLNMAAFSTIQDDQELKAYYERRVKDGKSKMSTINIVRNKIVHRIFAVVKRGTPYVPLYKHAV